MIKLFFLCRRRPGLTRERYAERLLEGHVPIALRHHPTLRRYVVNVVVESPPGWPELDSIGELWFDTLDDFRDRLYDSPEGKRIVEADVARFLGAADAYATTEYLHRETRARQATGRPTPGVKIFCPIARLASMSRAVFADHWLGRHAPLALRHHPGLLRYAASIVDRRLSPEGEELDGFAELTFETASFRTGLFDSPQGERIIRDDIARFIGRTGRYLVTEYVQKT
jgi:uncharacterized protein (TIGR02118 family)